jgi:hypothetical protein
VVSAKLGDGKVEIKRRTKKEPKIVSFEEALELIKK